MGKIHWDIIHQIRGAHPPDHIVGYECYSDKDEEEEGWHIFICASHEKKDYFEGWIPVTVLDTHTRYYQCDRIGCEMGYAYELIDDEEEEKEEG